jgi:hypothetical protein
MKITKDVRDVGYHSSFPMYEDQPMRDCDFTEAGKCYYDGSGLNAERWTKEIFSVRGQTPEEIIWPKLEKYYSEVFGE